MASSFFRKKPIDNILQDAGMGIGSPDFGSLKRVLGVRDLTFLGIAVIIGAGVFGTIGRACYDGGPGVIALYIFIAFACGFAALCYAEFAGMVPVSGSAYTYAYVAFGEIFAWIMGWDLVIEYAIGNIAIAISWSDYFTHLMNMAGWHIPDWLTMDSFTAANGFKQASAQLAQGVQISALDPSLIEKFNAWSRAPIIGGYHMIFDLPAFFIVVIITYIVFIGISESRSVGNAMVILKLAVIFLVIVLGAYYTNPQNWSPFAPNGISGILKGVSAVFFAYIGFDALSTTAEECKDPQRDLPRGMLYSLLICTVLYILLSLVLTGMISYTELNVGDPLAKVFYQKGLPWISGIIAISAIIATGGVLLVCQIAQPRIWMSMGRDGLLPKIFSTVHKKYKTPSFATLITGFIVSVCALFFSMDLVLALCSIGTLFAFVMVCGGILVLDGRKDRPGSKFRVPYINGKFILPLTFLAAFTWAIKVDSYYFYSLFTVENIPLLVFWLIFLLLSFFAFLKNFSVIPSFGVITCMYLMAQESHITWLRFFIWLVLGLIIYFFYGRHHSKLNEKAR